MIAYLVYRLINFIANNVTRTFGNWISLRIADCNYFFNSNSRESSRANLEVIMGPNESAAHKHYALRWVFRCFGKYMFEFVGNKRFNPEFFNRCVTLMGLEHVSEAREKGRGAVLIGAHLGNWELGAAALCNAGLPMLSIIQKHPNPRIHGFFMKQRDRQKYDVVVVGEAARPSLRHLKNNGVMAVLGDRPYGEEGIEVDFFGQKAIFAGGPARMALTAKAALIPTFVLRRWDDSFRIFCRKPIIVPDCGTKDEKILAMTQEYADQLEKLIRENPTQWPTFYRVFEGTRMPEDRGI